MTDEEPPRRIHFMTNVVQTQEGWLCERCGTHELTKEAIFEHRKGIISECDRRRLKRLFRVSSDG